jgi:S-adenosylmethionine hydrolase
MSLITLTTDFGEGSSYVAAMKGAVLSVNANARLLDVTHSLPPQDLVATSWFLHDALPYFPADTIHVVVVDPGVGTDRALLCVEWRRGFMLVPDNGCWTSILKPNESPIVRRLENSKFWRQKVSATFHGRDILAPVAGHLSVGLPSVELGPEISEWVRLVRTEPVATSQSIRGTIVVVDPFGNLVTDIPAHLVEGEPRVKIGRETTEHWVKSYGHAEPGTLVALIGSTGRLEVAVVYGSAARRLGVGAGEPVDVKRSR